MLEVYGAEACKNRGVVIGYDGRHNSKGYAHISSAVFQYYNVKCILFEDFVATPIVPFSTLKYNCLAGIMVTASHNPKQDNGYKVYWTNGAQIIEPNDKNIREHIQKNLRPIDLSDTFCYEKMLLKKNPEPILQKTLESYLDTGIKRIQKNTLELNSKCKQFVYTAMHGVGYVFAKAIFNKLGFKEPAWVKEQIFPDPEFSTVVYPNPEEGEGSLVLIYSLILF